MFDKWMFIEWEVCCDCNPSRAGRRKEGQSPGRGRAQRRPSQDLLAKYFSTGIVGKPPQASWAPRLHKGRGDPLPWQLSLSFCTNLDRSSLLPFYVVIEQTTPFPIQIWRSQWHSTSRLWQGLGGTDRMWLGLLLLCCYSSEKWTEKNLKGKSPRWHWLPAGKSRKLLSLPEVLVCGLF